MRAAIRGLCLALLLCGCRSEPVQPQVDAEVTRRAAGTHYLTQELPAGGVIRYTIYVPADLNSGAQVPLVLASHFGGTVTPWLGGDYANLLVAPALAELGAVIVAPDASTAGGWSAADEARVMWLVREVARVYPVDPERTVMTGFSAGGAQTWTMANRNQDFFTAVIPMAARPRPTEHPWRIPVYVIHSRDDELIPFATVEAYVAEQRAAGAPMHLELLSGISHYQTAAFVPALRAVIPWLREVWP